MASDPEEVIGVLRPSKVREVMGKLRMLSNEASAVRKGSELLALSEQVMDLVDNETKARFGVKVRRTGTPADLDVMFTEEQVMHHAAQLDNAVVELGKAIEGQLEELDRETREDVYP